MLNSITELITLIKNPGSNFMIHKKEEAPLNFDTAWNGPPPQRPVKF